MLVRFKLVIAICLFLVIIHLVNSVTGYEFTRYGIRPRHLSSFWTIVTAPLLHWSWAHLCNNLLGLVIFSYLRLIGSVRQYFLNSLFIILFAGLMVWAFARPGIHLGASGWVFGLWGLCLASAWFERSFSNIGIAVFVLLAYGGLIYGIFPHTSSISFESHLFGLIAGISCAYLNSKGFFSDSKNIFQRVK